MDWATQPDPFRRYEGVLILELPLAAGHHAVPYADLFRPGAVPVQPLGPKTIAVLMD